MTTRKTELIGMYYSPWTEKARWALDHHAIPYRYTEHMIIFGMPAARLKLGKLVGDVTIPALIDGDERIMDSHGIARHADRRGSGPRLFPESRLAEIEAWNAVSETAAESIRALVMSRIARDPEARGAALKGLVPGPLRRPLSAMAFMGIAYIDRAFDVSAVPLERRERDLRGALLKLREGLAGRSYLLGDAFSYADIAMAVSLQGVAPVADEFLPLEPATRRAWRHEALAKEFADLVEWRDRLYRERRAVRTSSSTTA